jgi:hypothetical protein
MAVETMAAADPVSCLDQAGLSQVEQRSNDYWRGNNNSPFYQVGVDELASAREARKAVRDATDVYAASGGKYLVTGPARPSAGGQLSTAEADTADSIVQAVASCLGA